MRGYVMVGQCRVEYAYNPLGRYFNLWFTVHGKCVFFATLFKAEFFMLCVKELGYWVSHSKSMKSRALIDETYDLVIEWSDSNEH